MHTAAMAVEKLIAEALALSAEDRGKLVTALLERLTDEEDGDPVAHAELEAAWAIESDRRLKAFEDGTSKPVPHDEVMRELYARFPKR